ncbi:hypothetical protein ACFCV3_41870 [Kribbella sp. NPDC056345]|uniref:hypothetical protein n=1 Tax=Kribbella sp. NPDC056345 TaxID=3345789 RepID=UPI0035D9F16A
MSIRQTLADAANTVPGVHVHPYYRQGGKTGHGNVVLARVDYPNIFGGIGQWEVIVLLPVDVESAQNKADELIPLLYAALSEAMAVDSVTFGTTSQDNRSGQPCLIAAGHREME